VSTRGRVSPRVGDVLQMPLGRGLVGHAQLVAMAPYGNIYVVVFRSVDREDAPPPASSVVRDDIAFVGNTLDGNVREGSWRIVGNLPPDLDRVPFPAYKFMRPPNVWFIESFDGSRSRPATTEEADALDFRETVSPAVMEHALAKLHGLRKEGDYGAIEYGRVKRLAELARV
jgi:hypothetical protein